MDATTMTIASFALGCLAIGLNLYVWAKESRRKMIAGQWIPVSEELPEPDYMGNPVGVLACLTDGEVCIGFCENDEYGVRWHCQSTQEPTHWMPLPEPPEVK